MLTKPVIVENFITPEDAQVLMDEMLSPSEVNPYPEYYKKRFGGTGLPYNDRVNKIVKHYALKANKVMQELNPEEEKEIKMFKAFGCVWHPGGYGGTHMDDQDPEMFIDYSSVVYLNDEFTGGQIFFPVLGFDYFHKKYSAVFFISDGERWKHGITPVESGKRGTLLFMHTITEEEVDPDLDGEE
jgi:hypothetical protein